MSIWIMIMMMIVLIMMIMKWWCVQADLMLPLPLSPGSQDVLTCVGVTTYLEPPVIAEWCKVVRSGEYSFSCSVLFSNYISRWLLVVHCQDCSFGQMEKSSGWLWEKRILEEGLWKWAPVLPANSEGPKPGEGLHFCLQKVVKILVWVLMMCLFQESSWKYEYIW